MLGRNNPTINPISQCSGSFLGNNQYSWGPPPQRGNGPWNAYYWKLSINADKDFFPSLHGADLEQNVTTMHPFPISWNYLNVNLSYLNDEGYPFLVIIVWSFPFLVIVPAKEYEEQYTIMKETRHVDDLY